MPKMEVQSFYDLISERIVHCFCHILFVGNKSINPAYTQGEGITQEGREHWGPSWRLPPTEGIIGATVQYLEVKCHDNYNLFSNAHLKKRKRNC